MLLKLACSAASTSRVGAASIRRVLALMAS
jgi:hypothetical protein